MDRRIWTHAERLDRKTQSVMWAYTIRSMAQHTQKRVQERVNMPMLRVFEAVHTKAGFKLSISACAATLHP